MKPKGLLVAVVLLAVLGGAVWYSNKKQAEKEKAPAADASPKIVSIPDDQVADIRIQRPGGETVELKRDAQPTRTPWPCKASCVPLYLRPLVPSPRFSSQREAG